MKKTSKFFATGDDSSEEDERSEHESEEEQKAPVKTSANRFARAAGFQSDSDDDSKKRVVKSQKDKKEEELTATIQALKNHLKINDWKETLSDFEKLNKQVQKEAEVPAAYIKTLIQLEDVVKKTSENADAKKKMSATNSKSFNALKQKLKKNNKAYADQIEAQRKTAGPVVVETKEETSDVEKEDAASEQDNEEAEESEEEEEKPESEEEKPREPRKPMGRAFWLKSTTEKDKEKEKSDSEDEQAGSDSDTGDSKPAASGKSKWMKDDKTKPADKTAKPATGGKKPAGKKGTKAADDEAVEGGDEAEAGKDAAKKDDKKVPDEIKWTAELVDKRLVELQKKRGRKEVDKTHHAEEIEKLLERSFSPAQTLAIMVELVKAQFDVVAEEHRKVPSVDMWRRCYRNLARILALLRQNPALTLDDTHDDDLDATVPAVATVVTTLDATATVEAKEGTAPQTTVKVTGNLLGFLERLDDEFTRSLQLMDPHMAGYQQHLADELLLVDLAENVKAYYDTLNLPKRSVRVAMRILEHYYYKTFPIGDKRPSELVKEKEAVRKAAAAAAAAASTSTSTTASAVDESTKPAVVADTKPAETDVKKPIDPELVPRRDPFNLTAAEATPLQEKLAHQIYANGDERLKTRAVLCQIYHYSLHDRFFEARDMMLMSHLQDSVQHMEISTQILFNRTMVQLGMCAFRRGLIGEAHSCLAELYAGGRVVKEFLAQGTSTRFQDKNPETEKAEKRRLVPHHMHINLEMLEAVHLISAMLLEVPNMAANVYDTRKKVISRMFRRLLESSDRQVFSGPPENVRESVVVAARALFEGDVTRCSSLLLSLAAWNMLQHPEPVKAMLKRKIQEEGVRTWLFTNSRYYDSIGLDVLSSMFDLPQNAVHSIVSKMMINEELHGSWDQPTNAILLHKVEPTRLQFLALQLSEKIGVFVDNNERVLDIRSGGYSGYRGDNKREGGQRQNQDGWVPQDKRRFQGERYQGQGQYKGQYNRGQQGDRRDGGMRQSGGAGGGMQRSGGYGQGGYGQGGYGQGGYGQRSDGYGQRKRQ